MVRGRRSVIRLALVLLACAASGASLGAQDAATVTIAGVSTGARVRIATRDAQPFVGTLMRNVADTLVVELPSGAALSVPRTRIARLDVSGGVQRHTWQGAGIGLLVGAGAGTVVALTTYRRSECIDSAIAKGIVCPFIDQVSRQTALVGDAAAIGTAGTLIGALIGHVGHETWIPVAVPRVGDLHGRLTVQRVARSTGIGVALEF